MLIKKQVIEDKATGFRLEFDKNELRLHNESKSRVAIFVFDKSGNFVGSDVQLTMDELLLT